MRIVLVRRTGYENKSLRYVLVGHTPDGVYVDLPFPDRLSAVRYAKEKGWKVFVS